MKLDRQALQRYARHTFIFFLSTVIIYTYVRVGTSIFLMHKWGLTFRDQYALQMLDTKTLDYLPQLDIHLKHPIPNVYYKNDPSVLSLSERQQQTHKVFGLIETNTKRFEESNSGAIGDCTCVNFTQMMFIQAHACVTNEKRGLDEVQEMQVRSHEEMHVVQFLKITEAYDALQKRFKRYGYDIVWKDFDIEEQADLVGLLRLWEHGYRPDDKRLEELSDFSSFPSMLAKLNRHRKKLARN